MEIKYSDFIKDRRVVMAMITSTFAMMLLLFFNSTLSWALSDAPFNVEPQYIGYFFALPCVIYMVSSIAIYKMCTKIDGRY